MDRLCVNCEFFVEMPPHQQVCRRHPPVLVNQTGPPDDKRPGRLVSMFPETKEAFWCGE